MYKMGHVLDKGINSSIKRGRCQGALYRQSIQLGKGIGNKAINGSWRGRPKRRSSQKSAPDTSRHCGGGPVAAEDRVPILKRDWKGKRKWKWKSLRCLRLFATPWTIQSMEFSRSGYWMGSRCLLQGIFPYQGSNPGLPHCRRILYQQSCQRRAELRFRVTRLPEGSLLMIKRVYICSHVYLNLEVPLSLLINILPTV